MWTHVKFVFDGEKVHLPIEFFKSSLEVERELRSNKKRDEYVVFWSPDDTDTPESVEKDEVRVLEVDNINPSERERLLKKFKKGIPCWYKASLLQWDGKFLFSRALSCLMPICTLTCIFIIRGETNS